MKEGIFMISLDFELHWGGFEKWPIEKYQQYFYNTRNVIPEMLKLFTAFDVHVTWASVGMLFHKTRDELVKNAPAIKPGYKNSELSAYHFIETQGIGTDERSDPLHFASSLIEKIIATPHQELGSHTFSHFYCNEEGQTVEQFREDLRAAQRIASQYGKKLKSLVFPRNQFNDKYLKVCYEEGITAIRSNPLDWFWNIGSTQNESGWKRLNRGLDAYIPIGGKNTYRFQTLAARSGFPVSIPASRLLRPYRPQEFFLNTLKINRIKSEMKRAARNHEIYHLWWHPHNFGNYPTESLKGLLEILEQYADCRKKWGMKSYTMNELASSILHET